VEIPSFPHNKRLAVTFSFDDGPETDRPVIERLNQWGLKATWNLNSAFFGGHHASGDCPYVQAHDVAKLYAGHEVAIHTISHPFLQKIDPSQVALEVLEDRKALEDLVGYAVRGMAYPFGAFDQRVIDILRSLGIVYARTTQQTDNCFPPAEPLAWGATGHQYAPDLQKKWDDWYASKWFNGVFFVWGHTYEFKVKGDWGALERIFKPLSGKPDVWYCTNIELFDYEAARRRLVIGANRKIAFNPSAQAVTILVNGKTVEVAGGTTVRLDS
jgi:hypothetical protein